MFHRDTETGKYRTRKDQCSKAHICGIFSPIMRSILSAFGIYIALPEISRRFHF
jgi:hypothetical protein